MRVLYIVIILMLCGLSRAAQPPELMSFEKNIRPILSQQCYECHSSQHDIKGGLSLDSKEGLLKGGDSGPALVPGKPEKSLILSAIKHEDYEMPPDKKLSDTIAHNFETWIKYGAFDPRTNTENKQKDLLKAKQLWSFKPLRTTTQSIDDIIDKEISKNGLSKVARSNEYSLVRRLYFDLTGLPPTPEFLDAYVNNVNENKYENLIDHLLSQKEFGERWGRHWLDIARYGDSTGKDQNITYPYAYQYRDYVIDAFNNDKPYDVFVKEQIAGDLLPHKTIEQYNQNRLATGFLAVGTKSVNQNEKQYRADLIDEQIDSVTRGFLGLTLSCARCHDHKFDALSQEDYYAIYGIFQNTLTLDGVKRGNNNVGYQGDYDYLANDHFKTLYYDANKKQNAETWELLCSLKNLDEQMYALQRYNRKPNEQDLERINKEKDKVKKQMEEKFNRLEELGNDDLLMRFLLTAEPVMSVKDTRDLKEAKIQKRGNVNDLGDEVPRRLPELFVNKRPDQNPLRPDTSGRLQLANWITDRSNPLTYRVHANRVWKYLFGKGIVDSFDNFGVLSAEPSNIILLDKLAKSLIRYKFSTKQLIKEIVMSEAYQSSTDFDQNNYDKDPDNIYFWRMNEKRLEAEVIRDTLLFVQKEFDRTQKDHVHILDTDRRRPERQIDKEIAEAKYRTLYLPAVRDKDIEMLDIFDRPDNNLLNANRSVTTVPTQALYLMNNQVIINHCDKVAGMLLEQTKDKEDSYRVKQLYLKYLSRYPSKEEQNLFTAYIEKCKQNNMLEKLIYSNMVQTLISTAEFRDLK